MTKAEAVYEASRNLGRALSAIAAARNPDSDPCHRVIDKALGRAIGTVLPRVDEYQAWAVFMAKAQELLTEDEYENYRQMHAEADECYRRRLDEQTTIMENSTLMPSGNQF